MTAVLANVGAIALGVALALWRQRGHREHEEK